MAPPVPIPQVGQTRPAAATVAPGRDRLGLVFILSLAWLMFDLGRPPTPAGVPLLLSGVMFAAWVGKKDKQWSRHSIWWLVLLGVVALGMAVAENTYSAFVATRLMATLFITVCLPLQALVTSVRKVKVWLYGFVGVAFYVGSWAVSHGGFGPAGTAGQDENYVATLMGMGVAFAYFSIFAEKRFIIKALLGFSIVIFVGAMALAHNASRGGFLALCAVALYCLTRSPRKLLGLGVLSLLGVSLLAIAGPSFWQEIGTTTDYESGTGDTRIEVWKAGMRMWQGNPVLGVGAGNFRWAIGDYQTAEQFEKFGRSLGGSIIAHSLPVETMAELGSLGAIAVIVLVWTTWTGLGKIRVKKPPPGAPPVNPELLQLSIYADALRAGIIAVLVNGVFLSLLYYSHLWVLIAVGSALPFLHRRILAREQGTAAPPAATVGRRGSPGRGGMIVSQTPLQGLPRLGSGGRR